MMLSQHCKDYEIVIDNKFLINTCRISSRRTLVILEEMTVQYKILDDEKIEIYRCSRCYSIGMEGTVCVLDPEHGAIESRHTTLSYMLDSCSTCNMYFTTIQYGDHPLDHLLHSCHENIITVKEWIEGIEKMAEKKQTLSSINEKVNKECDTYIGKLENIAKILLDFDECKDLGKNAQATKERSRTFSDSIPVCQEKEILEKKILSIENLLQKTERIRQLLSLTI
jgi:hypothetical protein